MNPLVDAQGDIADNAGSRCDIDAGDHSADPQAQVALAADPRRAQGIDVRLDPAIQEAEIEEGLGETRYLVMAGVPGGLPAPGRARDRKRPSRRSNVVCWISSRPLIPFAQILYHVMSAFAATNENGPADWRDAVMAAVPAMMAPSIVWPEDAARQSLP